MIHEHLPWIKYLSSSAMLRKLPRHPSSNSIVKILFFSELRGYEMSDSVIRLTAFRIPLLKYFDKPSQVGKIL